MGKETKDGWTRRGFIKGLAGSAIALGFGSSSAGRCLGAEIKGKASIKIHALHVGTINRPIKSFYTGLKTEERLDFPVIMWYIEGAARKILVDTGAGDPATAEPRVMPYKRDKDQTVERALQKIGVECNDIDLVILTHMHWDHVRGLGSFPGAKIIVQEEELRNTKPLPSFPVEPKYEVISGDKEIVKGITAVFTPGHTQGMQGVLVETGTRRIFIACDTIPVHHNIDQDPWQISPIVRGDKDKYRASLEKIRKLSAALVLPGHEFKVFERITYE